MAELIAPKVVLWRHGQTDWNVVNRFQGHSDIPLNDVGHYQVNHAAKILAGMNPTRIISSDLIRAKQTAQALLDLTGLTLEVDPDLRETNGGKWEGKTGAENRAEDGVRFTQWLSGEDVAAGETGEKRSEVAARAMSAIERAVAGRNSVENETIVFVTHGGAARCLVGSMLNLPFDSWASLGGLSNACWSVLEKGNKSGWTLAEHNAGSIPEPVFGNETLG
jgi:probable phosphoglycerate mutase